MNQIGEAHISPLLHLPAAALPRPVAVFLPVILQEGQKGLGILRDFLFEKLYPRALACQAVILKQQQDAGFSLTAVFIKVARAILRNLAPEVDYVLEPHDSFFVGSDVFYTYIVDNGFWDLRIRQRTEEGSFSPIK